MRWRYADCCSWRAFIMETGKNCGCDCLCNSSWTISPQRMNTIQFKRTASTHFWRNMHIAIAHCVNLRRSWMTLIVARTSNATFLERPCRTPGKSRHSVCATNSRTHSAVRRTQYELPICNVNTRSVPRVTGSNLRNAGNSC